MSAAALGAHFRPTGRGSEVYCTVDLAGPDDFDPDSPVHLTALERTGRRLAIALTTFLCAHHPAFARAELAAFPARVGIRESRRVRGELTVTGKAVLCGLETPDCVALGTWPMELREKPTGPRWRYPEDDRPTQIPLGALKVAGVTNLWDGRPLPLLRSRSASCAPRHRHLPRHGPGRGSRRGVASRSRCASRRGTSARADRDHPRPGGGSIG